MPRFQGNVNLDASRIALVLCLVGASFVLLRALSVSPEAPAVRAAEGPLYSPFVVQVSSEAPFGEITFKDVGMSLPAQDRAHVYETLAESLSRELSHDVSVPMSTSVTHDPRVSDPSAHLACAGRHIYVDLWQDAPSETWGYCPGRQRSMCESRFILCGGFALRMYNAGFAKITG